MKDSAACYSEWPSLTTGGYIRRPVMVQYVVGVQPHQSAWKIQDSGQRSRVLYDRLDGLSVALETGGR